MTCKLLQQHDDDNDGQGLPHVGALQGFQELDHLPQ